MHSGCLAGPALSHTANRESDELTSAQNGRLPVYADQESVSVFNQFPSDWTRSPDIS